MSLSLRAQVHSFIAQGEELLNRYLNFKSQSRDFTSELAKEALSDTAVVVASSLFELPISGKYVKRGVKGFLETRQRAQIKEVERCFEGEYISWVGRLRGYLESISIVRLNLKPPGNSSKVVLRLLKAQQHIKLDTRSSCRT